MLLHIRLPLISVKHLAAEIKLSGYFNDQHIFEGIQFKVAPEILSKTDVEHKIKYQHRGSVLDFGKLRHSSL